MSKTKSNPYTTYADRVEAVCDYVIAKQGSSRPVTRAEKICGWTMCPLACGACCLWSTIWRVLACPCVCAMHGPGACCSNNGCTDGTDDCICACVTELERTPLKLGRFTGQASTESTDDLVKTIEKVLCKFQKKTDEAYTIVHYTLFDTIVVPLVESFCENENVSGSGPANADELLKRVLAKLKRTA